MEHRSAEKGCVTLALRARTRCVRAACTLRARTDPLRAQVAIVQDRARLETVHIDVMLKKLAPIAAAGVHTRDDAVVHMLFQHPNTRSVMCRMAGPILRKQVRVCCARMLVLCALLTRATGGLQLHYQLIRQGALQRHRAAEGHGAGSTPSARGSCTMRTACLSSWTCSTPRRISSHSF